MSHSLRSRVFLLECTVALAVSSLLWLLIAPVVGAARLSVPWSAIALIIGYSLLTRLMYKLGIPASMLISARFNAPLVVAGFLVVVIGLPYAFINAAALLPGVHVMSQGRLIGAVIAGSILHGIARDVLKHHVLQLARRDAADRTQLIWRKDDEKSCVYYAKQGSRGAEVVLPASQLTAVRIGLDQAVQFVCAGQMEAADKKAAATIPDLDGCGFRRELRLQMGYVILRQSYEAAGNWAGVEYSNLRIAELERAFSS